MWEPCMAASTYRRCMHTILDFVFSKITADMLALDDIAAEETFQVFILFFLNFLCKRSTILFSIYLPMKPCKISRSLSELFIINMAEYWELYFS